MFASGLILLAASSRLPAGRPADTEIRPRQGIEACEVSRPSGEVAFVELDLEFPTRPATSWRYEGILRSGRLRLCDGIGLLEPGGELVLEGGRLEGSFRRVDLGGTVHLEARVVDGLIEGTARVDDRAATVRGRIVPGETLRQVNAVSPELGWPASQGPAGGGCSATPTGVATASGPDAFRLRWHSEEIDIGRAMGNITRFMHRWKSATTRRTGSGCASPVVADGRVYFKYFVPAPRPEGIPEKVIREYSLLKLTESAARASMLEEARASGFEGESLPTFAAEKVYQTASDIVLCLDAATGQTLWKATVKARGVNSQHHKSGPFDLSPAVGHGRVFALGMSGWLHAFDAKSGEPLWEVESELDFSNALRVIGDVVIAPVSGGWGGYEVETGKLRWKVGGGRAVSTLSAGSHGGRDLAIGVLGPRPERGELAAVDVATGERVWTLPVRVLSSGRGLGPGGVTIFEDWLLVNRDAKPGPGREPGAPEIAAYRLKSGGPEFVWAVGADPDVERVKNLRGKSARYGPVHPECVPVVVRGRFVFTADLRLVELATGRVVATTRGVVPSNGGYLQAVEDLVIVRRDGTHGNLECGFYRVSERG